MTDQAGATGSQTEREGRLSPDDNVTVGTMCFHLAHHIDAMYGLAGVRAMKAWCREKLPHGAFPRGYYGARATSASPGDTTPNESEQR